MLKWIDIIKFSNYGNPTPDRRVEKTEEEWKAALTDEQYRVCRMKGTERAFSTDMCSLFKAGKYACVCCGELLFDSGTKFESGTGWPSFTQPIKENAVAYRRDDSLGMRRIEALCNTCDAHLGHVFLDGPAPGGLRYCINSVTLKKVASTERKATFGGGCFWCTDAIFQELIGVVQVESGYSGGQTVNPTYREVCSGRTGHAEVIEVTYLPEKITFEELIRIHLSTHNPTLQPAGHKEKGAQYRSIVFYRDEEEKVTIHNLIEELQPSFDKEIVTEVRKFEHFYKAEVKHQEYYKHHPDGGYCQNVIDPKLREFRQQFSDKLKT